MDRLWGQERDGVHRPDDYAVLTARETATRSTRRIWSNNPLSECLNRELRRRIDVVGIFLDRAAAVRLMAVEDPQCWLRGWTATCDPPTARVIEVGCVGVVCSPTPVERPEDWCACW
jgi:hypothetical protein